MPSRSVSSLLKHGPIAGLALVLVLFGLGLLDLDPYDDGYFFKRLSVNLLDHGVLAWNVDEGPVYGSTSQLFQWLSVGVTALTRDYYVLATRAFAGLTLLFAFAILRKLTVKHDGGVAALYAFCTPVLLYPLLSGMETALAVLVLSSFLSVTIAPPVRAPFWVAPVLVVAVYTVRPDATLLALPLLLLARYQGRGHPLPFRELVIFVLLFAALLTAFKLYYHTALPLPFYAKQSAFSPYDAHFKQLAVEGRRIRFGLFAASGSVLFVIGMFRRDKLNLTLLGTVVGFTSYHLFTTVDVMGMQGRFYVPAMPSLVVAAARASESIAEKAERARPTALVLGLSSCVFLLLFMRHWLPPQSGWHLERVPVEHYYALVACMLLLGLSLYLPRLRAHCLIGILLCTAVASSMPLKPSALRLRSDDEYLDLVTTRYTVYRGLDTLRACFGERIHVYHSEVGLPGLRFMQGKVSDLAGLLSRRWLFRKKPFDGLCRKDKPEAIFLPHKNYRDLNAEIRSGRCIKRYTRVVKKSSSPLYVRDDLYPQFMRCAQARNDPFVKLPKQGLLP